MLQTMRTILIVMLNLVFYGIVLFGCVQIIHYGHDFAYDVLGDNSVQLPPGEDKTFEITDGQSEFCVAGRLFEKGLIRNKFSFYTRMKLEKRNRGALESGSFTLNTSMTYAEIMDEIYGGS